MLKKWKLVLERKTIIKSFLPASLFLFLQMEGLIFSLNYSTLKKNTKIRNEIGEGEGRKIREIEGGRRQSLTVFLFELIIKLNEMLPFY